MELTMSHTKMGLLCSTARESLVIRGRMDLKQQSSFGLFSQLRMPSQLGLCEGGFVALKKNSRKVSCLWEKKNYIVEGRSIEEVYDTLTERLLSTVPTMNDLDSKYLVGLAGPPGAGKSTLASEVVCRLNKLWSQRASKNDYLVQTDNVATVLPMDGFHLYRAQLDAMENPEEAHARRGAPWTFNPDLLLKCLSTLKNQGSVYAPSFNHGVGDPVEDDIFVSIHHKVVIVEGNYLLMEEGTWKEISSVFSEKWFIDIDLDTAMERVLKRHISTGKKPHVAKWRVEYNDRRNAELIMQTKKNADVVIKSITIQS